MPVLRAWTEDRWRLQKLGLSYGASMALVVVPQAVRTMIPSIINQFIITLKDTSILSVVAFPELTLVGKTVMGNTFKPLQIMGNRRHYVHGCYCYPEQDCQEN